MCHCGGELDQRLDATERFGEREDLCRFDHPYGSRVTTLQYERDHAAAILHVLFCDLFLRMRGVERVEYFFNLGMSLKKFHNCNGVLEMPVHAKGERLDAT